MPLAPHAVLMTKRATVAAWTPASAGSLLLAHHDASDAATITQSGGAVSQWNDKSGKNYHALQATGANRPLTGTRTVNGLNVIVADGSNDTMAAASGTTSTLSGSGFFMFCVMEMISTSGGWQVGYHGSNDGSAQTSMMIVGNNFSEWSTNTLGANTTPASWSPSTPTMAAGVWLIGVGVTSDHRAHWVVQKSGSGTLYTGTRTSGITVSISGTLKSVRLFQDWVGSRLVNQALAEGFIINDDYRPGSANATNALGYLATKWGIT